jgi:hypothetical protein
MKLITIFCIMALAVSFCRADLIVTQGAPKTAGNKAIVPLRLQNTFAEPVQSARAVCFLLDEQGEVVGQTTKWVIGQNKMSLAPKGETTFSLVITRPQPFTTTNLTARVSFTRVVLDSGKQADPAKDVKIQSN